MLNVENLCHTYNLNEMPKNVLNKVSFELKNNEILGILGTSGSGCPPRNHWFAVR